MNEKHNDMQTVKDLAFQASFNKFGVISSDGAEKSEVVIYHKDMKLADVDDILDTKSKYIKNNISFLTIESFIMYINEFKTQSSIITGDPALSNIFECVIDYHTSDEVGRCQHVAHLNVMHSEQWKTWHNNQKNKFAQKPFLTFLEMNILDIKNPSQAEILDAIRNISIYRATGATSKISDERSEFSSNIDEGLHTDLPTNIVLNIAPYKLGEKWEVNVRLFTHIEENEILFSYQILNSDRIIESVFNEFKKQIDDQTGILSYV